MKEITRIKKFYISVENPEYSHKINDSETYPIEYIEVCNDGIQKAVNNGSAITYNDTYGNKITIPYNVLKKSVIKLTII